MSMVHAELTAPQPGTSLAKNIPNQILSTPARGFFTFTEYSSEVERTEPVRLPESQRRKATSVLSHPWDGLVGALGSKKPRLTGWVSGINDIRVQLGSGPELQAQQKRTPGQASTPTRIDWSVDVVHSGAPDFGPVDVTVRWTETRTLYLRDKRVASTTAKQLQRYRLTIDGDCMQAFAQSINAKWQTLNGAQGPLGNYVGALQRCVVAEREYAIQRFDHGSIVDLGNGVVSAGAGGGAGGGGLLPETPYRLTLEKVTCAKATSGELGADELWARFVFATNGGPSALGPALNVVDYRNGNVGTGAGYDVTNHVLYEGSLPEFFNLYMLAIEVDFDPDAQAVMTDFVTKLSEEMGLWFTPGSDETESRLAFNLNANRAVGAVLVSAGDFWTKIISTVMGLAMEALLQGLAGWYKPELIAALSFPPLGEYIRKLANGELPVAEAPQEVTVYGYSSATPLFMKSKYTVSDDGSVLEERRFLGGEADADYTFTLRHWVGNGPGAAPSRSIPLSIDSNYISIFNPNKGTSSFGRSENKLTFSSDWSELGYMLERSVNGAAFVQIASVPGPTVANSVSYTDIQLSTEETVLYRVRAYNRSGYGPYSNTVVSALPVPAAPYGLSASKAPSGPGALAIHVYWMDNCEGNLGYSLERSRSSGAFTEVAYVNALNPSTRGANHVDAVTSSFNGEVITYRVRSESEYGRGPYSDELHVVA